MRVWVIQGDVREVYRQLKDHSIDCVITSPPYWRQRDYGVAGQIGKERIANPFAGSGTVGEVAVKLGRNAVLIEINPDYIKLIKKRLG